MLTNLCRMFWRTRKRIVSKSKEKNRRNGGCFLLGFQYCDAGQGAPFDKFQERAAAGGYIGDVVFYPACGQGSDCVATADDTG